MQVEVPMPSRVVCRAASAAALAVGMLLATGIAHARTWRVERDGSADFTTLQPAVDVAAAGDTILIGPGDYTELAPFPWDSVATGDVAVGIRTDDLTLIGTDRDAVRIGPAAPDYRGLEPKGIAMKLGSAARLRLRSLTVRNVRDGLYLYGWADVRDVVLDACVHGAFLYTENGASFEDCFSTSCLSGGILVAPPGQDLLVSRCEFANTETAVGFISTPNGVVRDCDIHDVIVGVQYQDGATGAIERSTFRNVQNVAIGCRRRITLGLNNNRILSGQIKVDLDGASFVTGSRNVFGPSSFASFNITDGSTASLHENHILPGTGRLVRLLPSSVQGTIVLDFSSNYWGGADSVTVAEKIWDSNDDQAIKAVVQFSPMLDHPVPAPATSLGGLKARFGNERKQ